MPPASRGSTICIHTTRPRIQPCYRRHISIQKPRDPRNFPTQARARFRAKEPAPEQQQQQQQHVPREGLTQRWKNRYRRFFVPQWLQSRPFLRTTIYSFFVTVPISGFLLMHLPFEPRRVTGPSMKPTINPDCDSEHDANYSPTYVLVQTWDPNRTREKWRSITQEGWTGYYKRGDLVVYQTPHDPDKVALKRVVGVPADTVVPLKGYEGGEDPVTVQYYQLWVEGDVNDRKKSIDSNYFGPISEALVRGKVIAMWSPWWNIFSAHRPDRTKDDWPARKQGRVAERAVYLAATNPDRLGYLEFFRTERGDEFLRKLRQHPDHVKELFEQDENFRELIRYHREHGLQLSEDNTDVDLRDRARTIVAEMDHIFGRDRLESLQKPSRYAMRTRLGTTTRPEIEEPPISSNTLIHEDERVAQREARERPAKAALEQMVRQTKQLAEQKEKEMEERQSREI